MMNTVEQNRNHRNDLAWIKTGGKYHTVNGVRYGSEYVNTFTGQAVRKGFGMTGLDWFIFNADDRLIGRSHSLTYAKMEASR